MNKARLALLHVVAVLMTVSLEAAVENCQPSMAVHYYISGNGLFPTQSSVIGAGDLAVIAEPDFYAEVRLFTSQQTHSDFIPADGSLLAIWNNSALFSLIGTIYGGDGETTFAVPNLEDRVPIGEGQSSGLSDRRLGSRGGAESVLPVEGNLPSHAHDTFAGPTGGAGSDTPMENMQPWLALTPLIATSGTYPSEEAAFPGAGSEPYLGEIRWFASHFTPRGWAKANGQLLPISQYSALYSLLWTNYGGDGEVYFALPDLRGRAALDLGQGVGLSNRVIGEELGDETVLIGNGMPSHSHTLPVGGESIAVGAGATIDNMMPSVGLHHRIDTSTGEIRIFAGMLRLPGIAVDGVGTSYDMRGRIAIGAGDSYSVGASFGTETITLTNSDLPVHSHTMPEYITWAQAYGGLTDVDLGSDGDDGNLPNLIEFVVGGDPSDTSDDISLRPTYNRTGSDIELSFRRTDSSVDYESYIQYSLGDLDAGWLRANNEENGISVVVDDDHYGTGIDRVRVSIPHNGADKLFVRLAAEE